MPGQIVVLGRNARGALHRTVEPEQFGNDRRVVGVDLVGQPKAVGAWGKQTKHARAQ
ncbi:Uncharacterised protein [Mycobacteroides abscessus subsp. massiliense]|nr:Uncharacterised protein [Mycobacteroides abscessus subsp. massiliense]